MICCVASAGDGSDADAEIAAFVERAQQGPCALFVEGEAGMGKTTLWLRVCEAARREGFHVLSGCGGQAETVMAYATIADLLTDVDPDVIAELPALQRLALRRVAMGVGGEGPATDHQGAAAALGGILAALGQ